MIRKIISQLRLRIGSASIDLILDKDEFRPGEKVTGYFFLKGGRFEQKINRLECDLVVTDEQKKEERFTESAVTRLMSKPISSKESSQIPFTFQLPSKLDTSPSKCSYRFRTKLVFSDGTKSVNHDQIKILNEKNQLAN
ncbi:sporulation protein [Domibacillus indicus]|uniref:sporulation protein n=1 Tax=Domibacillus indicus TaxID=1437523 RepID=UPI00203EB9D9|nr:sporulation protein [Domibacillus indicus]MCM3791618.1 sporulation protein [Domibacillus indicus]